MNFPTLTRFKQALLALFGKQVDAAPTASAINHHPSTLNHPAAPAARSNSWESGRYRRASDPEPRLPKGCDEMVKQAVTATFSSILGEEPVWRECDELVPAAESLVGVITLTGDHPTHLMFAFPEATAVAVAAKFVGMEIDFSSADMDDAAGELVNIAGGDLVAQLEAAGIWLKISPPKTARGEDAERIWRDSRPGAQMRFDTAEGEFWAKIAPTAASPAATGPVAVGSR
jgi:CheY-specific phosphatase CheX